MRRAVVVLCHFSSKLIEKPAPSKLNSLATAICEIVDDFVPSSQRGDGDTPWRRYVRGQVKIDRCLKLQMEITNTRPTPSKNSVTVDATNGASLRSRSENQRPEYIEEQEHDNCNDCYFSQRACSMSGKGHSASEYPD